MQSEWDVFVYSFSEFHSLVWLYGFGFMFDLSGTSLDIFGNINNFFQWYHDLHLTVSCLFCNGELFVFGQVSWSV